MSDTTESKPATVTNPATVTSVPSLSSVSRIDVPASTRAVPQSDRDLIQSIQTFVEIMSRTDLAVKLAWARINTVPGHADLIDTLARITKIVEKMGS